LVVRKALADIVAHTAAEVVFHIATDTMPLNPAIVAEIPRCEGVSFAVMDFRPQVIAAWPTCDAFGAPRSSKVCWDLIKVLWHRVFPESIDSLLVLDADIRVIGDVRELFERELAAMRATKKIVGVAMELQPTYLSEGLGRGYNGGVQLQDLAAMRASTTYATFLVQPGDRSAYRNVADLSDQTLYTMLNATAPLVHELPCVWNLQFCLYHFNKKAVLRDMFAFAHISNCVGAPRLAHGNGGTYHVHGLGQAQSDQDVIAVIDLVKAVGRSQPWGPEGFRC
jgi:hypothetical protein